MVNSIYKTISNYSGTGVNYRLEIPFNDWEGLDDNFKQFFNFSKKPMFLISIDSPGTKHVNINNAVILTSSTNIAVCSCPGYSLEEGMTQPVHVGAFITFDLNEQIIKIRFTTANVRLMSINITFLGFSNV